MAAVIYLDAVLTAESPKRLCLHSVAVNPHEAGAIRDIYTKKNLPGTGSIFVNAAKLEELYCILRGLCLPHGSQVIIYADDDSICEKKITGANQKVWNKIQAFCDEEEYQVAYAHQGLMQESIRKATAQYAFGE